MFFELRDGLEKAEGEKERMVHQNEERCNMISSALSPLQAMDGVEEARSKKAELLPSRK